MNGSCRRQAARIVVLGLGPGTHEHSQTYSGKWPFFMLGLLSFAGVVLKLFFSLTTKAEKLGLLGCVGFNATLNSIE